MTSSPGPTPAAAAAALRAEVAEFIVIAWRAPKRSAHARSSARTRGPP